MFTEGDEFRCLHVSFGENADVHIPIGKNSAAENH